MNRELDSTAPDSEVPPSSQQIAPPQLSCAIQDWLKLLFVCNPFYLASAALLLYGVYRISIDPLFLKSEVSQLVFNFTSLQIYELLLVGTGIFLARRLIWHDAKLLVVLENMFLLIPFILVSQAALIEQRTVLGLCLAAALLAAGRMEALRRGVREVMPAVRAMICGAAILLVNTMLPIIYRHFHETKYGTKYEFGAAYDFNQYAWLLLLPALASLLLLLPRPEDTKGGVRPRWFAMGLNLLWLTGTGVHLYCLGYVYDFDLSRELLAPGVWVLAWVLHSRLTDFTPTPPRVLTVATLLLPFSAGLLPASETGSKVLTVLCVLNALGFGLNAFLRREPRLTLHLALLSVAAAIASMPVTVTTPVTGYMDRTTLIAAAALAYLIFCAVLSGNPKVALPGSLAAAAGAAMLFRESSQAAHWAIQVGLVFFLMHSLRWRDHEHQGAAAVRVLMSVVWIVHAGIWAHDGAAVWQPLLMSVGLLFAASLCGILFRGWPPLVLLISSVLVALSGPANTALTALHRTPAGVVAMLGSLALFVIGTVAALMRHRWHKRPKAES